MPFLTAQLSRTGGREINEDYCATVELKDAACWVVADGLGGHKGGEKASQLAVEAVLNSFRASPALSPKALQRHIKAAQNAILARVGEPQSPSDMRTTLTVLITDYRSVLWAHLGDTRLYYLEGGRIIFQTKDHTVPQALVSAGDLSPDAIRHHPDRNRLLRSLGGEGDTRPEIVYQEQRLYRGDVFLLCTDGFWEYVSESEMEVDLAKVKTPEEWLAKMEARLADRAPEGNDNYTALALFFDSPDAPEPGPAPRQIQAAQPKPARAKARRVVAVAAAFLLVLSALVLLAAKWEFLHRRLAAPVSTTIAPAKAPTTIPPKGPSKVDVGKAFNVRLGKPYATIQQACAEALDGDEIWIGPGNHRAFTVTKRLLLRGAGYKEKDENHTEISVASGQSIDLGGDHTDLEEVEIKGEKDSHDPVLLVQATAAFIHDTTIHGGTSCLIRVAETQPVYLIDDLLEGDGDCICKSSSDRAERIRIMESPGSTCRETGSGVQGTSVSPAAQRNQPSAGGSSAGSQPHKAKKVKKSVQTKAS